MRSRAIIIVGAVLMALAVAFGAFGAHIVQDMLTPERFDVYKTAVEYHFYHAMGLLFVGVFARQFGSTKWFRMSAAFMFTGIVIFSGSLYLLTLTDTGWLGAITPIGGAAFILGWGALAIAVLKHRP